MTKLDALINHQGTASSFRVKNNAFRIRLGNAGKLDWFSESLGFGSGKMSELRKLLRNHDQLTSQGKYAFTAFEFTKGGRYISLIGELNKPIKLTRNGEAVLRGNILEDVVATDKLDIVDVVGTDLSKSHNRFNSRDFRFSDSKIKTSINTFKPNKISRRLGSDSIPSTYELEFADSTSRSSLQNTGSEQSAKNNHLDVGTTLAANKDIPLEIDSVKIGNFNTNASITPNLGVDLTFPSSWLQLTNRDQYSINVSFDTNWDVNLTLDLDAQQGGLTIRDQTFSLPATNYSGFVSLNSSVSLDSLTIDLPGLESSYSFDAGQKSVGGTFSVNGLGNLTLKPNSNNNEFNPRMPELDPITGLGMDIMTTASANLQVGLLVPDALKSLFSVGGVSIPGINLNANVADITVKLDVPLTLKSSLGSNQKLELTANGNLDISGELLGIVPKWEFSKDFFNGNLFSYNSGNHF